MSYKVTSPLVIVPNADGTSGDGYFYKDAVIPGGFNDERLDQLADEGMVEAVEESSAADEDEAPAKSASKGDWVAYATDEARGDDQLTEEEANSLTKDQLVERILGKA